MTEGKSGSRVICWTNSAKTNEEWVIEPSGDGYVFHLKNYPDLCLTQSSKSLTIQKESGKDDQVFILK